MIDTSSILHTLNRRSMVLLLGKWSSVTAGSGILLSCSKKNPVKHDDPMIPEPVNAGIDGIIEAREKNSIRLTSNSTGEISAYEWKIKFPNQGSYEQASTKTWLSHVLDKPGIYEYLLTVTGKDGSVSQATHDLLAVPRNAPYYNDIAFFRKFGTDTQARPVLYTMDPLNPASVKKVYEHSDLKSTTLAWHPRNKSLLFNMYQPGFHSDIVNYDLKSGSSDNLTGDKLVLSGLNREASWRPDGEWIAFTTDARHPTHAIDELVLINEHSREIRFLSGPITWNEAYRGHYPRWSPDGSELAVAGVIFVDRPGTRIGIFSNLFDDAPSRRALHSEDYLNSYFSPDSGTLIEGNTGMSWSPNGQTIAFTANYQKNGLSEHVLVIANADGSGIQKSLKFPSLIYHPVFSPGGRYILFQAQESKSKSMHIFRLGIHNERLTDLTVSSGSHHYDGYPTWYG